MDKACERCGTFAVLESNGFRELCAPCGALLEVRDGSLGGLLASFAKVLGRFGLLTLGLMLVQELPLAAVALSRAIPSWVSIPYAIVVGSLFEACALSVAAERALGGRSDLGEPLRRARSRYLAMVGVNAIMSVLMLLATLLLCIPAIPLATVTMCAVPLVLFERAAPHRAIAESFRRVRPIFWAVAAISSVLFAAVLAPSLFKGTVDWIAVRTGRLLSEQQEATLRVSVVLFRTVVKVFSVLFQLVVWGATRPSPLPRQENEQQAKG